MSYNTNTPDFNVNSKIRSFSNFDKNAEKQELKDIKRTNNSNHRKTKQVPGNSKLKYNRVTRKMDDLSMTEVDDKLDALEESMLSNLINTMSRFIDDYNSKHNNFEQRGLDEAVGIIKNSKDLDSAIENIENKINEFETTNKGNMMPEENKDDMIKGMQDTLNYIKGVSVSESRREMNPFLKITSLKEQKRLEDELEKITNKFKKSVINQNWFDKNNIEHKKALNESIRKSLNKKL